MKLFKDRKSVQVLFEKSDRDKVEKLALKRGMAISAFMRNIAIRELKNDDRLRQIRHRELVKNKP